MRGKFVNVCMALLNLLLGATIIVYALRVPSEITELTVQEYQIIYIAKILIYIVFGITTLLNIIHFFLDIRNGSRKIGYLIAIFAVSFIFIKLWFIGIFSILAGLIILFSSIRIKWIETNSFAAISLIIILTVLALGIIVIACIYENLGIYIRDKENEDELKYKSDFFRYITELPEDNEAYLNVKKDGKYGYINPRGEVVIDFEYDYASPFIQITAFNKHFCVALVCKGEQSIVILKNKRQVLTYRSESVNDNYSAKIKELEDIYYNTLGQTAKMIYELDINYNGAYKIPKYDEVSEDYTYRYDFNEEYDVLITKSNMGLGDSYELARKDDLSVRIPLECESLSYDENYLYIYRNGTLPFFDRKNRQQGWFTGYGRKGPVLKGNAQILDFFGDYTLIKNHNDKTIYFIDLEGNIVSEVYKEVFICNDDRFIVKGKNNKYVVINSAFENVFNSEWDFVDTSLTSIGLYVFGRTNGVVDFSDYNYATNMKLEIFDNDGNKIADGIEQVYSTFYEISGDKSQPYSERYSSFLDNLKVMNVKFIGDEFYK